MVTVCVVGRMERWLPSRSWMRAKTARIVSRSPANTMSIFVSCAAATPPFINSSGGESPPITSSKIRMIGLVLRIGAEGGT